MKLKLLLISSILLNGCSTISIKAPSTTSQRLNTPVRTRLPVNIKTTGDAIKYYLNGTGYKVTTYSSAPRESSELLKRKIIYRGNESIMPITAAITRMFDYKIKLYLDHQHKLVSVGYDHVK